MPPIPGRALLSQVRDIARWEGIPALFRHGLRRILHPVLRVRRFLFFEMDLTQPFPRLEARVPLEMRVASTEDLETFDAALAELGVDMAKGRERLERGDLLTLGLHQNTLVHAG